MISKRLRHLLAALVGCALLALGVGAGAAAASPTAWWLLDTTSGPTNLVPASNAIILTSAVNEGYTEAIASPTNKIVISDTLPVGLKLKKIQSSEAGVYASFGGQQPIFLTCETSPDMRTVKCPLEANLLSYEAIKLKLEVEVEPSAVLGSTLQNHVHIEGGKSPNGEEDAPAELTRPLRISEEEPKFGAENFEFRPESPSGTLETQAGAHPFQMTTTLDFNKSSEITLLNGKTPFLNPVPARLAKNLHFVLPPGLIGSVAHRPTCTEAEFETFAQGHINYCKGETAIGVASVTLLEPNTVGLFTAPVPVFNLRPAPGEPARFGFELYDVPITLTTRVRSGSDYAVEVSIHYASEAADVLGSQVTFWGVPGDPRHDESRGWECLADGFQVAGVEPERPCVHPKEAHPTAFLSLPTSCEGTPTATASGQAWSNRKRAGEGEEEQTFGEGGAEPVPFHFAAFTGCSALHFEPEIEVQPDSHSAATPSGLTVNVKVPQGSTLSGEEGQNAEAAVRETTLTLPAGIEASGGAANGLATCTTKGFGFDGLEPVGEEAALPELTANDHFNEQAINETECPPAAKIGTVDITTPLLEENLKGSVYLAREDTSLFHSPLILFIFAESEHSKVQVKLAGEVQLNEQNGQLTSVFRDTPPVPFSELSLHLFDGARASQSTPEVCGEYGASASFQPWSTPTPTTVASKPFSINSEPGGAPCVSSLSSQPFAPSFEAGSQSPQAGAFSPFTVTLRRPDGNQALRTITVHEPEGAAAMLSSVTPCPIAQAMAKPPTCPASSLIGKSTAVAGLGTSHVSIPGEAFLTTGFDNAPFGLLSVSDAEHVGPFDLGRIPVLSTITVNETTAAATISSEPLPQYVKGVPSQIMELNVTIDRPGFTFNPTNCAPLQVGGTLTGYGPMAWSGRRRLPAPTTPPTAPRCPSNRRWRSAPKPTSRGSTGSA